MLGTLPYAGLRFAFVLGASAASLLWLGASLAAAIWLSPRSTGLGLLCLACGLVAYGAVWRRCLRPELHLVECGHLAVLTERLTGMGIDQASRAMFFRGRRIARQRLRGGRGLLALRARLRAVLASFHGATDWAADLVPAPLRGAAGVDLMLRAVGAYLEQAVLSYDLARQDSDPWRASKDGVIYYCQNAKPILHGALRIVLLDLVLTAGLWLILLLPASLPGALLAEPWRESAAMITAALLAGSLRAAFVKPVLLVMILVRYHALAEGQVINPLWHERLAQLSSAFRSEWQPAHA